MALEKILVQILERLERIEERLAHQGRLLSALEHSAGVARAERESITMALARSGGQIAEIGRVCDGIAVKIEILSLAQDSIKENIRDQSLDINLLKKIISF